MVAIKMNADPIPFAEAKVTEFNRCDMFVNILVNLFCTPLAIGYLYFVSFAIKQPGFAPKDLSEILVMMVAIPVSANFHAKAIGALFLGILMLLGLIKEENLNRLTKIKLLLLIVEPVIYVTPGNNSIVDSDSRKWKRKLRVVDLVAIAASIASCHAIYFSKAYQEFLLYMYFGSRTITTAYVLMYVLGLIFWVRQYIHAVVEARCGLRQACYCHPWKQVKN